MIIYFANRKMEILGNASTHLPNGYMIADDLKIEDIETGVACFECKLPYSDDDRAELAELTEVGNYILRSHENENEFYTIIETETDTKDQTIYIYAEDAGLDLLNEIAPAYEATGTHTAEWYVNRCIYDSGFEIGINEIPDTRTRKLSWDSEQTVTERLASIATGFGGFDVSYSFDVDGLKITHKYINIYEKRGKDNGVQLRLNNEVDRIVTTKSIANVATALKCTGGTPDNSKNPITLSGYSYDDGDFFVDGVYLKSREALADWSRYAPEKVLPEHSGHIVQLYEYDTLSQATLCSHAITELKKLRQIEVNYEVDIKNLPDGVAIGDRVNIIDDDGELYLSTRLLKLETSVANNEVTATLGEYLIKSDGISEKVEQMAADLAKNSASTQRANLLAYEAKTTATEAGTVATDAKTAADNAQTAADNAKTAANNAQTTADNAQTAAEDAAKSATDYISPQSTLSADDGIKVFPKSEKDNPQNYTQINQDGVGIYQNGSPVASFGADMIELGKNNPLAKIDFCGGQATLENIGMSTYLEKVESLETGEKGMSDLQLMAGKPNDGLNTGLGVGSVIRWTGSDGDDANIGGRLLISTLKNSASANLRANYSEASRDKSAIVTCNVTGSASNITMSADSITINGYPLADYVVEQGTSGIWTYEKWASGKAVAYMPEFYEYSNLKMTASGNLYLSEERYATLPSGLFVDNNYIVSHEIQSASGPVSIIRQSGSTNAKFLFKIYKVFNTSTGVSLKFNIKGRWKNDTERNL